MANPTSNLNNLTHPQLLSQNACARLLGMHKSALCTLRQRHIDTFPKPFAVISQTFMFDRDQVVSWYAQHRLGLEYDPSRNKGQPTPSVLWAEPV